MRLFLVDKNAKTRDKHVEESRLRMKRFSGMKDKVIEEVYHEIYNYEELFKVVYEVNTLANKSG